MNEAKRNHWADLAEKLGLSPEETKKAEEAAQPQEEEAESDESAGDEQVLEEGQYREAKTQWKPPPEGISAKSWQSLLQTLGLPVEIPQTQETSETPGAETPAEQGPQADTSAEGAPQPEQSDAPAGADDLEPMTAMIELPEFPEPPVVATVESDYPPDTPISEEAVLPPGEWGVEEAVHPSEGDEENADWETIDETVGGFYDSDSAFKASTLFDEDDLPSVPSRRKKRRRGRRKKSKPMLPVEETEEDYLHPSADEIEPIDDLDEAAGEATTEAAPEAKTQEPDESDKSRSKGRGRKRKRRSKDKQSSDEVSDSDEAEPQKESHRGITTWDETIGAVIDNNLKSRQNSSGGRRGRRRRS